MINGEYPRLKAELLALVKGVVRRGEVTLSSGDVSDFYIDLRLLTLKPHGAYLIAELFYQLLANTDYDAFGGLTMGADPIVGAFCYHAYLKQQPINGFIIRKSAKGHGTRKSIEGPEIAVGSQVVIVDDVVTSGSSIVTAYKAVSDCGGKVVKALAVVDREEGAAECISQLGIDYAAILTRSEILG